ncbi:hypothetical protein Tco_0246828, partial [Tanacetum coccineum]
THPHPKRNFVPTAVATKSGQVPVNAAKQSSPRVAASISTVRPVNTDAPKPKVNVALPTTYSYFKAHSLLLLLNLNQVRARTLFVLSSSNRGRLLGIIDLMRQKNETKGSESSLKNSTSWGELWKIWSKISKDEDFGRSP